MGAEPFLKGTYIYIYEDLNYAVFVQPPVPSSLFGPNILLNTLFSNKVSLCPSLDVRD
jgi:hypothetical protein